MSYATANIPDRYHSGRYGPGVIGPFSADRRLKLFDRLIRFNQAARLRTDQPTKDWLSIAVESGYYDYQHLTRDFRAFPTLAPNDFLRQDSQAVPCQFGLVET